MECIGTSRLFLIRTYPIETAHKDIAKLKCIQSVLDKAWSKLKARVFLETNHVDWDNRHIRISGLFEGSSDKSDVVCRTASATCLWDEDGCVCHIIVAWFDGCHNLANDNEWRVAGVVVYELKSHVHTFPCRDIRYDHIVAGCLKGWHEKVKVYRWHLRADDGVVVLFHLLGEYNTLVVRRF